MKDEQPEKFDLDTYNHLSIGEDLSIAICSPQQYKSFATQLVLSGVFKKQIIAMRRIYYRELAKDARKKMKKEKLI